MTAAEAGFEKDAAGDEGNSTLREWKRKLMSNSGGGVIEADEENAKASEQGSEAVSQSIGDAHLEYVREDTRRTTCIDVFGVTQEPVVKVLLHADCNGPTGWRGRRFEEGRNAGVGMGQLPRMKRRIDQITGNGGITDEQQDHCKRNNGRGWQCGERVYKNGWCEPHFWSFEKFLAVRKKRHVPRTDASISGDGVSDVDCASSDGKGVEEEMRGEKRKATLPAGPDPSLLPEHAAKCRTVDEDHECLQPWRKEQQVSRNLTESRKSSCTNRCHQCWALGDVVDCRSCEGTQRRYCMACIAKWYPHLKKADVEEKCPFCWGYCNCKKCLRKARPVEVNVPLEGHVKARYLHYLLQKLMPSLRQLDEEQRQELKLEMELQTDSSYQVETTCLSMQERMFCNGCKTSIVDYHRTCAACEYDLCLSCCVERRMQAACDGSYISSGIMCPPQDLGGCGSRAPLSLRSLQGKNALKELLADVEKVVSSMPVDMGEHASERDTDALTKSEVLCLAAHRDPGDDNYLFAPSVLDGSESLLQFQKHWNQGQPIIVRDVNRLGTGLSWDPMVMWRAVREMSKKKQCDETSKVKAIECSSGCEVEIGIRDFFVEYGRPMVDKDGIPDMYKLKDWPPSSSFSDRLPRHNAEFIKCLPFKHYTHPEMGIFNLAAKFPPEALRPDLGPKTYIAYGVPVELSRGNSVTKLHCDMSDAVNVLMHTKVLKTGKFAQASQNASPDENSTEALQVREDPTETQSVAGALWDIFRREDVGRLQEYIQAHWREFFAADTHQKSLTHPVHDQVVFLSEQHKRRLKEEMGVEAWTFKQHVGEAVFIPAGCPHQVRNLHPCIKVALDFVSPENVDQCIKLTQEFRLLPHNHPSKEDKLGVRKMIFQAAKLAVKDFFELRTETPKKTAEPLRRSKRLRLRRVKDAYLSPLQD